MQDTAAATMRPLAPLALLSAASDAAAVSIVSTISPPPQHGPSPSATSSSLPTARTLLPLQPRLQLTTAHLTAAIAAVAAQPVTPTPRAASAKASSKPRKLSAARAGLVLPAPLLAAAASALGSGSENDTAPSPTHSAASSASTAAQTSADGRGRITRKMKKCTVTFCESYARSRGLCKAHGGGKRCNRPGCEVSDQGGGFCIRHGGGKRCLVEGCDKSAQSRHYCKAHGGGARCVVDGCGKSSQGGGRCRAHGGGPRRKRAVNNRGELVESPRTKKRTKYKAELAARTLMGAAQAIEEQEALGEPSHAQTSEQVACEPGSTVLSFKIRRPLEAKPTKQGRGKGATAKATTPKEDNDEATAVGEDHDTYLSVAASLLGMQTAAAE